MRRQVFTTRSLANEYGCAGWLIRRITDQIIPDCARVSGNCRVLSEDEADRVRKTLELIGLKQEVPAVHA
jgi:hypothetical protein